MSWLWRTVILNLVCFFSSKPWFLPQHKYFSSYPIECCDILKTQLLLKFISNENRTLCQSTYLKVQGKKSLDQPDKRVLSHISHGRCVMGEFPFQTRACALLSWGGERNSLSEWACAGRQVVLLRVLPLLPSLVKTSVSQTPAAEGAEVGGRAVRGRKTKVCFGRGIQAPEGVTLQGEVCVYQHVRHEVAGMD